MVDYVLDPTPHCNFGGGSAAWLLNCQTVAPAIYRVGQKPNHFKKCITLLYNDIVNQSIYRNVQLFIGSKNDILNAAMFKYYLHKISELS